MIHLGGMLGIAACLIGMAIFMGGCLGFQAAFALALVPMAISAVGLTVTVVGGMLRRGGVEHTSIVMGIFLNVFGLIGGLLELALWKDWAIFYRAPGP